MKKKKTVLSENNPLNSLSRRAVNILQLNRKMDLYLLTEHYKREGDFLSFRQCGPKLNEELVAFCLDLLHDNTNPVIMNHEQHERNAELIRDVARGNKTLLPLELPLAEINRIEEAFLKLSDRSRNMLMRNGIVGPEQTLKYYNEHGTFLDLNHCGEATSDEVISFCEYQLKLREAEKSDLIEAIAERH